MSNHFHLLVEEPDAEEARKLDRDTLLERAVHLCDAATVRDIQACPYSQSLFATRCPFL